MLEPWKYLRRRQKTDTASSSFLGVETTDQSYEFNAHNVRTYSENVFPSPIRCINSFLKKAKTTSSMSRLAGRGRGLVAIH